MAKYPSAESLFEAILKRGEFEMDSETGRLSCDWCGAYGGWDLEAPTHAPGCFWVQQIKPHIKTSELED